MYAPSNWSDVGSAGGFSGAQIYRLATDAGEFCLRVWPKRSLPHRRIAGLHRLLAHVLDQGVQEVPVPVASLSGETLVIRRNRAWQLEPWMPGRADFCQSPNRARLKSAMNCLAQFHQATEGYTDSGSAQQWFSCEELANSPAVKERLAYLKDWRQGKLASLNDRLLRLESAELLTLGREFAGLFERLAGFVEEQLVLLSGVRFRLQPCLRDIWHDHVLFTGDEVTGLIDASACRKENIATDLARLLGSFLGDDRNAWSFAIGEYEKQRPLDSHERALVQALDQSGVLLSGMAWLDRLVLQEEKTADWPRVRRRLETLRSRLKTLERLFYGSHEH